MSACYLQFDYFMLNFSEHEDDEGFFVVAMARWDKWMGRHQHLPLSMARLGCSSFFVGKWAGGASSVGLRRWSER